MTENLPLLLFAASEWKDRLSGLLRVGGGAWASAQVQQVAALADAVAAARPHQPSAVPLLAVVPAMQHGLTGSLAELLRQTNLATVILTDDREVASTAQ